MPTLTKTNALFRLMEYFLTQNEISSYDEQILDEFGCDQKTLERYLKEIESMYAHITVIKQSKKKVWRLEGVSDIFEEFVKNSDDISQLFLMAQEFDPEIFGEMERATLSRLARDDEEIFLFRNSIMEELQSSREKKIFKNLKLAIKNHEYRTIVCGHDKQATYKNIKCLKLVFMDNNWYLAFVDDEHRFRLRRLSFIEEVGYSNRNAYQKSSISKYLKFLPILQNSMTLYGTETKVATIKANKNIAKYFESDMKRFLPSQKFQENLNDGSVLFTVEYTQELEILPFIQKWLPDLIILEPKELRDAYMQKLTATLKNHSN
ncbi:MAG: WYL domain-containing protein [Campylobacterota bacterium]|nr:WYL domain-containing protein [Campylobacterota bacterium]